MNTLKSLLANPVVRSALIVVAGAVLSGAAGYLQGHAILGSSTGTIVLLLREVDHLLSQSQVKPAAPVAKP